MTRVTLLRRNLVVITTTPHWFLRIFLRVSETERFASNISGRWIYDWSGGFVDDATVRLIERALTAAAWDRVWSQPRERYDDVTTN